MGIQDQFKDKAERLGQKAKDAGRDARDARDAEGERSSREREDAMPVADRARQEAQDRFDQDFDA